MQRIKPISSLADTKQIKGFTIIEVLIVLAIAGLIMLIVFLAVPALQRNARNTQRRNDVGRIGAAIQEVLNNNNGDITQLTAANVRAAVGSNMAFYDVTTQPLLGVTAVGPVNTDTIATVTFYVGAVCANMAAGGGQGSTSTGAIPRSVAITYRVEPNNTQSRTCSSL